VQLKELRTAAKKSLAVVAKDIGTTPSTINRHERGITPISAFHRAAYATYYGVKAESIEQPERDEVAA
jgi:transcriptional regulator with XRE-family HTH domain